MIVASARVILDFYGNQNLKKKRDELEALFKETKRKFNISILEVEDFDDYERCVFGVALVACDEKGARSGLRKLLEHIDASSFARVVMEDSEFFHHD